MENELHVPVNKVVHIILKSRDVIHSFFMPHLRLKQDAVPGREIIAWFEATKPGRYEAACAELCGFGHYTMRGVVYVDTPQQYQEWVEKTWPSKQ